MTGADFSEVDIDLLADYIGGVLTGTPAESAVPARIAGDPAWRVAYESLGEGMSAVSAQLGDLGPEPMPADVADRLDAMLTSLPPADANPGAPIQAESDLADAVTADANPADTVRAESDLADTVTADANQADTVRADTVSPDADPAHAGTVDSDPAHTVTADSDPNQAVTGDAVAGGPTPAGHEPAASRPHLTLVGGGSAAGDGAHRVRETRPAPRPGRRLRWAAPIAVAAGVVALIGFGADYLAGREKTSASTDSASGNAAGQAQTRQLTTPAGPDATLTSGTDYTHATLGIAPVQPKTAPFTSAGEPGRKSTPEMASGVDSALRRLLSPAALAACLTAIQQSNAAGTLSVESVDYARFAGTPAVIVRFNASNGHWAWASGADCGTAPGGAATLDKVPVG